MKTRTHYSQTNQIQPQKKTSAAALYGNKTASAQRNQNRTILNQKLAKNPNDILFRFSKDDIKSFIASYNPQEEDPNIAEKIGKSLQEDNLAEAIKKIKDHQDTECYLAQGLVNNPHLSEEQLLELVKIDIEFNFNKGRPFVKKASLLAQQDTVFKEKLYQVIKTALLNAYLKNEISEIVLELRKNYRIPTKP